MVVTDPVHIAKEFRIGNTRIKISDDCCKEKTPEDIENILQHIAKISMGHLNAAIADKNNG